MKRFLAPLTFAAALLLGVATPVQARIGESQNDLTRRFGQPLGQGTTGSQFSETYERAYYRPGCIIRITFWKSRSVEEKYYKVGDDFTADFLRTWSTTREHYADTDSRATPKIKSRLFWENVARNSRGWENTDVVTMLRANAADSSWIQAPKDNRWFHRKDGKAWAYAVPRGDDGEYFMVVDALYHNSSGAASTQDRTVRF